MIQLVGAHLLAVTTGIITLVFLVRVLRNQRRPPASTLAWGIGMVLAPYVAVPLYLVVGGSRTRAVLERKGNLYPACRLPPAGDAVAWEAGGAVARTLQTLGAPPPRPHHGVELCADGQRAFDALLRIIEGAQRRIVVQAFILGKDPVGRAVVDALARKASAGVEVFLLLDALGCLGSRGAFVDPVRRAGGEVGVFLPVLPLHRRWSANLRNHRKLAVADERRAWVGGMNLAEAYMGPNPRADRWTDLAAVVEGPATADLAAVFGADWRFATGRDLPPLGPTTTASHPAETGDDAVAQVVAAGPDVAGNPLRDALLAGILEARERIWIVSPYFIPDEALAHTLAVQARAGREVRVIVPSRSNHRLADLARGTSLRLLQEAGAEILLFTPGMLHTKLAVIDEKLALFGSANADMRSLYLNFEVGVLLYSRAGIRSLAAVVEGYLGRCHPISPDATRSPVGGFLEDTARLFSPLL